MRKKDHHSL